MADAAAHRCIDAILWEMVTDPIVRDRLRASLGFCPRHVRVACAIAGRRGDQLGIAILYEDFVRLACERAIDAAGLGRLTRSRGRWRARADRLDPSAPCLACEAADGAATTGLRVLMAAEPGGRIDRHARRRDRAVCLPHLATGLRLAREAEHARRLLDLFLRGAEEVRADLSELIRKHDHRHAGEPTGEEAGSWTRAPRLIVGGT
jgi:hypothetical protein